MLRFILFIIGVMLVGTSIAGDVSRCPVDSVPIQITAEQTKEAGPVTTLSAAEIPDYYFRPFVKAVTNHVAAQLAKDKRCLDSAESQKRSRLHFVNWPIVYSAIDTPLTPAPSLDTRASGTCRMTSPWIDLAVEWKPVPVLRGIVRWNQRQFLADQAVLAGAKNVPPGVARPMTRIELSHFINEYEETELPPTTGIPARSTAIPIEARVPPDMLWLLRGSLQRSDHLFANYVVAAINAATRKSAESYTQLVLALIDRCFADDGAKLHYGSILDAADLIPLERYKIDKLLP